MKVLDNSMVLFPRNRINFNKSQRSNQTKIKKLKVAQRNEKNNLNHKILLNKPEITINRFAQEIITLDGTLSSFEQLNSENQREVILNAKIIYDKLK